MLLIGEILQIQRYKLDGNENMPQKQHAGKESKVQLTSKNEQNTPYQQNLEQNHTITSWMPPKHLTNPNKLS